MAVNYGDIILKEGVIQFEDGDIKVGDAKEQQIGAIVEAMHGNFRQYPTMAGGLHTQMDGVLNGTAITSSVKKATALDGWEIKQIDIDETDDGIEVTVVEADKVTDNTQSLV